MTDPTIHIPRASLWSVWEVAEEYALYTLPEMLQPRVLDIGANVGIFAIAAVQRWRGARVMSFEPHPHTAAMLRNNVDGLPVEVTEAAVVGYGGGTVQLFEGARNRLCCSLTNMGDQDMSRSVMVRAISSKELPACDVMKVDTEGSEVPILEEYKHLGGVRSLLVECHGQDAIGEAERVGGLARKAGMRFVDQRANTIRFIR